MCKKYEFNIRKFVKGQVWFCTEDQTVTDALRNANSKALNGSRPYFIVHVNGNMITCVPMTTNINGSDNRHTDIVFHNPVIDVESRLVVSQVTTKGVNEFTKYLYQFSNEDTELIINLVKSSIFDNEDTIIKKDTEKNDKKSDPEEDKRALIDLENRLRAGVRKGVPIFKTEKEASLWLNFWGDKKTCEVANYFGISQASVYYWRHCAKKKIKENT